MLDEYAIFKRCSHLRKNHLFYQGDDKCTKWDCQPGSNTDSGSKKGVYYCRYTTNMYIAFIIRNLF